MAEGKQPKDRKQWFGLPRPSRNNQPKERGITISEPFGPITTSRGTAFTRSDKLVFVDTIGDCANIGTAQDSSKEAPDQASAKENEGSVERVRRVSASFPKGTIPTADIPTIASSNFVATPTMQGATSTDSASEQSKASTAPAQPPQAAASTSRLNLLSRLRQHRPNENRPPQGLSTTDAGKKQSSSFASRSKLPKSSTLGTLATLKSSISRPSLTAQPANVAAANPANATLNSPEAGLPLPQFPSVPGNLPGSFSHSRLPRASQHHAETLTLPPATIETARMVSVTRVRNAAVCSPEELNDPSGNFLVARPIYITKRNKSGPSTSQEGTKSEEATKSQETSKSHETSETQEFNKIHDELPTENTAPGSSQSHLPGTTMPQHPTQPMTARLVNITKCDGSGVNESQDHIPMENLTLGSSEHNLPSISSQMTAHPGNHNTVALDAHEPGKPEDPVASANTSAGSSQVHLPTTTHQIESLPAHPRNTTAFDAPGPGVRRDLSTSNHAASSSQLHLPSTSYRMADLTAHPGHSIALNSPEPNVRQNQMSTGNLTASSSQFHLPATSYRMADLTAHPGHSIAVDYPGPSMRQDFMPTGTIAASSSQFQLPSTSTSQYPMQPLAARSGNVAASSSSAFSAPKHPEAQDISTPSSSQVHLPQVPQYPPGLLTARSTQFHLPLNAQQNITRPSEPHPHPLRSHPVRVYEAQPSQFWTGRFVALRDRFLSENLLPERLGNQMRPHHQASYVPRPSQQRPTHLSQSVTTSALTSLTSAPASSSVDEDEMMSRRIFEYLDSLCATPEARASLREWQQAYVQRHERPTQAPQAQGRPSENRGGFIARLFGGGAGKASDAKKGGNGSGHRQ